VGCVGSGHLPIVSLIDGADGAPTSIQVNIMTPALKTLYITVTDLDAGLLPATRPDLVVDAHMPGHAGCNLPNGLHIMLDIVDMRSGMSSGWQRSAGDGQTFCASSSPSPGTSTPSTPSSSRPATGGLSELFDAPWGMRYATVCDPDGNGVDLYATQPASNSRPVSGPRPAPP
jgi:hypothetical protein